MAKSSARLVEFVVRALVKIRLFNEIKTPTKGDLKVPYSKYVSAGKHSINTGQESFSFLFVL